MHTPLSRRRLMAAAASGATAVALPSRVLRAETADVVKAHGAAMHGAPKYGPDFAHFGYVNPKAPKGGSFWSGVGGSTFDNLNPFILKGTAAGGVAELTFAALMVTVGDEPFSVYGWVAKSIEIPKDRSWVAFEIDERAHFHDGTPVTAEDVVFSFETLVSEKGHPFYRQYYRGVTKAEVAGPRRVRFAFSGAGNKELPLILGQLAVIPKAWWAKREFDRVTLEPPLGSGPYKVAQVNVGRFIVFERVKDDWAAAIPSRIGYDNFATIRLDYFRDDTIAREAFKAGEFDYHDENQALAWATQYDIPPVREGLLVKRPIPNSRNQGMQALVFNTRRPVFADWRVRRALALAFDFEWTNKNLFYGQYVRSLSYFSNSELASRGLPEGRELALLERLRGRIPDSVFTEPYTLPVYADDRQSAEGLRRAFMLLQEAGWAFKGGRMVEAKTGLPLSFEAMLVSQTEERYLLPYAQRLARIGVTMAIRLIDPTQYQKRLENFDFDLSPLSWGQSESPGNEQRSMWSSAAAGTTGTENYTGIKSAAVDTLIEMVVGAETREDLVAATRALDRVLLHHHLVVPSWYIDKDRVLYWDKFDLPPPNRSGTSYRYWWYDAAKAARLKGRIRSER